METSNLPEAEFKTLVLRMLNELSDNFNKEIVSTEKEIDNIKKNQSETKTTITETKNILKGINSRLDEAEK